MNAAGVLTKAFSMPLTSPSYLTPQTSVFGDTNQNGGNQSGH